MKFTCTQENLKQGLGLTSKLSQKNAQLPILEHVKIEATQKGIQLTSTNLEIAISCHIRGKVDQEGEYTVPSKLLFDFVSLQDPERISIDLHDDSLFLACGNVKTRIKGLSASDFPLIPPVQDAKVYHFSISEFRARLQACLFAASTNESRPELAGVYFSFHDAEAGKGKCVMAATDSYRLSEVITTISGGDEDPMLVIVPQRTISELVRVLQAFKDDVEAPPTLEMHVGKDQVLFRYSTVDVVSRVVSGNYPKYRQIIPQTPITRIQIKRDELVHALKVNSLFARQGVYDIKLQFKSHESVVEVSSSNQVSGESNIEIPCVVQGVDGSTILNYRYLLDGLQVMDSQTVHIEFTDSQRPCVLMPEESQMEKGSFRYIVMPIKQ